MDNNLAQWLAVKLKERGWSGRELARRADISHGAVVNMLSENYVAGWDVCVAVAGPLGVSPVEVLIRAGRLKTREVLAVLPWLLGQEQAPALEQLVATARLLEVTDQECLFRAARGLLQDGRQIG
jgi:lambda repressor-like predicted transcriptional regulator